MNRPVPIEWDGFISDTVQLIKRGWEVQVDQDPYYYEARIAIHNKHSGITGFGIIDQGHYDIMLHMDLYHRQGKNHEANRLRGVGKGIRIHAFSSDTRIREITMPNPYLRSGKSLTDPEGFETIGLPEPRLVRDIGDRIFSPSKYAENENQIIVPEESVGDLLSRALEMQKQGQAEIRERNRKREKREIEIPSPQLQAQILSFKRA